MSTQETTEAVIPSSEENRTTRRRDRLSAPLNEVHGAGARWHQPALLVAEVAVALGVPLLLIVAGVRLQIDPLQRIGQVSILAQLQLVAAIIAAALVAALLVGRAIRRAPVTHAVDRLVWAGTSGIASGIVGGGTAAALHGTPWPLNATRGDGGAIMTWAYQAISGTGGPPAEYPPGAVKLLIWTSELSGWGLAPSQKFLQIVGVGLLGPLAYLAWRTILRPSRAAVVAVVSSAPFIEAYKPIAAVSLLVATPLFIRLILVLREKRTARLRVLLAQSALLGAILGMVFLGYSGWFVWCAPGLAVAGLLAFPWSSWRRGLAVVTTCAGAFVAVSWTYLVPMLTHGGITDRYRYFDTNTDPTYFAAWFGDMPGERSQWPPFGELGGVGVFTLLILAGMGVALAIGWHSWAVRVTSLMFFGAWFLRFWIARHVSTTGNVQLYPRTTQVLLLCALTCCALAICLALDSVARRTADRVPEAGSGAGSRQTGLAVGAFVTVFLLAASVGSATADRYMPRDDGTIASFAIVAHDFSPVLEPSATFDCTIYLGAGACPP